MSRPDAYMPLYWGDYWKDTGHLSAAEHGAYLNLIGQHWTTGKALPADDARLRRMARMDEAEWARSRDTLAAFFDTSDGTTWRHGRVEAELARATEAYAARLTIARKGATARWGENAGGNASSNADSNARSNAHSNAKGNANSELNPEPESSLRSDSGAGRSRLAMDFTAAVFDAGKALLVASGLTETRAGPVIGRWRKTYGDPAILDAIKRAEAESASDPVSFIEAILRAKHGAGNRKTGSSFDAAIAGAAAALGKR